MNEADKQELIRLCLMVECSECRSLDNEYTTITKQVGSITVSGVPVIRCKACGAISYPSIAYDYIKAHTDSPSP